MPSNEDVGRPRIGLLASAALCFYLAFYVGVTGLGENILPQKWFIDTYKIYRAIEIGDLEDHSFAVTAYLYTLIPVFLLPVFVAGVGVSAIYVATRSAQNYRELLRNYFLIFPLLFLSLLAPTKDLFVVLMSLVVIGASRLSSAWMMAVVFAVYGLYGLSVRSYYMLIAVVFLALYIFLQLKFGRKVLLLLIMLLLGFLMPAEVFQSLQGQRDLANSYALLVGSFNRTAFNNPLPPENIINFLYNYVYAIVQLNMPLLFRRTPYDLFLVVWLALAVAIVLRIRDRARWESQRKKVILVVLFCSHALVLWLFEPDSGSYLRHLSSAALYVLPLRIAPLLVPKKNSQC